MTATARIALPPPDGTRWGLGIPRRIVEHYPPVTIFGRAVTDASLNVAGELELAVEVGPALPQLIADTVGLSLIPEDHPNPTGGQP